MDVLLVVGRQLEANVASVIVKRNMREIQAFLGMRIERDLETYRVPSATEERGRS